MAANAHRNSLSEQIARTERTILEPIVEGEVALRVSEMDDSLNELERLYNESDPPATRSKAHAAVPDDLISDRARLTAQLRELCMAAGALRKRAARVEPDEKRVQDEVDQFIRQTRQLLTALRQVEQAKEPTLDAVSSHE